VEQYFRTGNAAVKFIQIDRYVEARSYPHPDSSADGRPRELPVRP
jgi:hypothetical protein